LALYGYVLCAGQGGVEDCGLLVCKEAIVRPGIWRTVCSASEEEEHGCGGWDALLGCELEM
jgi:hypothetical protein